MLRPVHVQVSALTTQLTNASVQLRALQQDIASLGAIQHPWSLPSRCGCSRRCLPAQHGGVDVTRTCCGKQLHRTIPS